MCSSAQRLAQQRIRHQVNLADGQVVGGAPVGVEERELLVGRRFGHRKDSILHRFKNCEQAPASDSRRRG